MSLAGPRKRGRYGIAPLSCSPRVNWVEAVPAVMSSDLRCMKSQRKQPGFKMYERGIAGEELYGRNGMLNWLLLKPFAIAGTGPSPKKKILPPWREYAASVLSSVGRLIESSVLIGRPVMLP